MSRREWAVAIGRAAGVTIWTLVFFGGLYCVLYAFGLR